MTYPTENVIRDIEYARPDGEPVCLDIYPAADQSQPAPVIVLLHGGGWAEGDKSAWGDDVLWLTEHGFTLIAVQYRLSGRSPWPGHIHDCKAAVRFIRANADKYKINPDRIAAMGASAGGHLAAMMVVSGGVEELEGAYIGNAGQSSSVCAALNLCGPSDMLAWHETGAEIAVNTAESYLGRFMGGPVLENKDIAVSASTTTYVNPGNSPLMILHGEIDDVVPVSQSDLLVEKLLAAGVEVEYHRIPEVGHGIDMLPFRPAILAFFAKHLKGNT